MAAHPLSMTAIDPSGLDQAAFAKSSRRTTAAIIVCGLAMIVEGFDTYAVGYVGPLISKEWAMTPLEVGQIYSFGVAASLIGSVVFGALADRFGRRKLLVLATVIFGLATLLGAGATSVGMLILSRVLAGGGWAHRFPAQWHWRRKMRDPAGARLCPF